MERDVSFVLLVPAAPYDPSELHKPFSQASQVARGRGEAHLTVLRPDTEATDELGHPEGGRRVVVRPFDKIDELTDQDILVWRFEEGQLQVDTGFMMYFVSPEWHDSPVVDVLERVEDNPYPLPGPAKKTIPDYLLERANERGYAKFTAVYDDEDQTFTEVRTGWENPPEDPFDVYRWLLESGYSEGPASDFTFFFFGDEEMQDVERIAEQRSVKTKTVKRNIKNISEEVERFDFEPKQRL